MLGIYFSGIFAVVLLVIGVLNVFLVHPVPGILYLLLSFLSSGKCHSQKKVRFLDSACSKNHLGHSHYLVHVRCE